MPKRRYRVLEGTHTQLEPHDDPSCRERLKPRTYRAGEVFETDLDLMPENYRLLQTSPKFWPADEPLPPRWAGHGPPAAKPGEL